MLLVFSFVFSALISMSYAPETLSKLLTELISSVLVPVVQSMSSANLRLVIILPPLLTVPHSLKGILGVDEDVIQLFLVVI